MTQSIKQYVDLEDIFGAALECKSCHAALSVRTDAQKVCVPKQCPSCEARWFISYNNVMDIDEEIRELFERLRQLRMSLEATGSMKIGFGLKLEVPPSASSPASSSRDA